MTVSHTRIQHGVGQGSFHSASVLFSEGERRRRFDYIYDCGALANWRKTPELSFNLKRIWLEARPGGSKPVLDLLVLSHFDWDHMNGASEIVESYDVDRIVLPYLGPVELALIVASQAATIDNHAIMQLHNIAMGGGTLWGRPITMVKKGAREERRPDDHETPDFFSDADGLPTDGPPERAIVRTLGGDGSLGRVITDDQDLIAGGVSGSSAFSWKVRFWNRGFEEKLGDLICQELARVGFPVHSLEDREKGAGDIVAWLNVKYRNGRSKLGRGGKKSPRPNSNRDLAVAAYRRAIDRYEPYWAVEVEGKRLSNFLSLGMYSGPATKFYTVERHYLGGHDHRLVGHCYRHFCHDECLPGWMGTGDAPLGEPAIWEDFKSHYRHELSRTQTILVPHHGAAPKLGPRFYNSELNHQPRLNAVISYGKKNQYGHPHPSVLSQIMMVDGKLIAVTEDTRLGFQESYRFSRS